MLPKRLGPDGIPIHGPLNSLRVRIDDREHQVFLDEPATTSGPAADRFRRVWRAVSVVSPVKPPL